jgi:hypothetical protein
MTNTNRKSTGRTRKKPEEEQKVVSKSEGGNQKSKPKATAKTEEENASAIDTPYSAIKELPTLNLELQTEPMEVHHHPEVEKKTFKEYLLEGLMIFIAVMMGFIAENIRENITNNEHARQLTSQLVQDLKSDTARLNRIFEAQTQILKANDSLFNLLQQPLAKADLKKIQQLIISSHNLWTFHPSGGAIGAIKNEMHLKQFSESKIVNHIAAYETDIELTHTVQDIYLQYQRTMLDPFLRQHFTPGNLYAAFNKKPPVDAQMRNLTQADLTQLAADMVLIRVVSDELVRDNRGLYQDGEKLLDYVKEEYGLE